MHRLLFGAAVGSIAWWLVTEGGFTNPLAAGVLSLYLVYLVSGLAREMWRRRVATTASSRARLPEAPRLPRLPAP